jgi:hypothetical protein
MTVASLLVLLILFQRSSSFAQSQNDNQSRIINRENFSLSPFWNHSIYGSIPVTKPLIQIDEADENYIHLFKTERNQAELRHLWREYLEKFQQLNLSTKEVKADSEQFCGFHQFYYKSIIQYQYAIPRPYLSLQAYNSSLMSRGDASMFTSKMSRSTGRCWKILVFGGSVTTADAFESSRHPGRTVKNGVHRSWTYWLNILLNSLGDTACTATHNTTSGTTPKHEVINLAVRARDTMFHLNRILYYRRDPNHVIHSADLIIIESAVNDLNRADGSNLRTTELLIQVLKQLKNSPALLWLAASLHGNEVQ